jgi:DNA repair exonuclease SbcCD ATPase subunit
MSIIKIEAKNFKIHDQIEINLNKQSALIIGDSGLGKSTIFELVESHLMRIPYPKNPLKDGANEGYTKTIINDKDGNTYTVTRRFKKDESGAVKTDRFIVTDQKGRKDSLENILKEIFGAFYNAKFDYQEYFIVCKSQESRFSYFIKNIGGEQIAENITKKNKLERERGLTGTQREIQRGIWEQGTYSIETYEKDLEYFSQERDTTEAFEAKNDHLKNIIDLEPLYKQLNNDKELFQNNEKIKSEIETIDATIVEYEKMIKKLKKEKAALNATVKANSSLILSKEQVGELKSKIENAVLENEATITQADIIFANKLEEISKFNSEKENFFKGISAFSLWESLDKEWNEVDSQIKAINEENKKILQSRMPLPEISLGEINDKPAIMFRGKEFSPEFLSIGERLEIASRIQRVLNPKGDNFVVIPEAQSLGSKYDEVIKEMKKYNVQYLVEITKPHEELHVEIVEE